MKSRSPDLRRFVEVTGSGRRTLHVGSGEPLVLLHMGANPWTKWQPVVSHLLDRFEIIAPTLAGWDGGRPLTGPIVMDDLTRGIHEEMDRVGFDSAHVVGCSIGGLAALGVARTGRARSVLAMCPAGGSNQEQTRRLVKQFEILDNLSWLRRLLAPAVLARPRMRRLALRAVLEHGDRLTARQAVAIGKNSANGDWDNLLPGFTAFRLTPTPAVTVPFMLAWAELDRYTPMSTEHAAWHRAVPRAEQQIITGVGHFPMFDDPEQTGRLMRTWLDRQVAGPTSPSGQTPSPGRSRTSVAGPVSTKSAHRPEPSAW